MLVEKIKTDKLDAAFEGPFVIIEIMGKGNVSKVENDVKILMRNKKKCKPFFESEGRMRHHTDPSKIDLNSFSVETPVHITKQSKEEIGNKLQ